MDATAGGPSSISNKLHAFPPSHEGEGRGLDAGGVNRTAGGHGLT